MMSIDEIKRVFCLEGIRHGEYQTLAGFALSQLGRVPELRDYFNVGGWRYEIIKVDDPRIDQPWVARSSHKD
jgi:putative hemolysin